MTYTTNRWFTNTGKRKRVPEYLEPFRSLIPKPHHYGKIEFLFLIHNIRVTYPQMSRTDARDFAVFLHGLYDNGKRVDLDGHAFRSANMTAAHFERGAEIFLSIISGAMETDKLEHLNASITVEEGK